jgi:predicted nucleic acid-binding Zn ribbon protein
MADGSKGPEKIADVLGRLFTTRGWGRKNDRLRLESAWAEAAGAKLLKETRVLGLRRGVLEVEVKGAVLLAELTQYHKRGLLAKLRERLKGATVTDIKFRAGAW